MATQPENQERLLNTAEREMVGQTHPAAIGALSEADLQALGKRLRQARDRSRRIAQRQQREMRGKADPHGTRPATENAGSMAKTDLLVEALKRVTAALRKLRAPSQAQLARKALAMKQAAHPAGHPDGGPTASAGMAVKESRRPKVKMDPREIGRVSQATKVAQAKRDR